MLLLYGLEKDAVTEMDFEGWKVLCYFDTVLPCPITTWQYEESLSTFFKGSFRYWKAAIK